MSDDTARDLIESAFKELDMKAGKALPEVTPDKQMPSMPDKTPEQVIGASTVALLITASLAADSEWVQIAGLVVAGFVAAVVVWGMTRVREARNAHRACVDTAYVEALADAGVPVEEDDE